jgi:hypothetical protein
MFRVDTDLLTGEPSLSRLLDVVTVSATSPAHDPAACQSREISLFFLQKLVSHATAAAEVARERRAVVDDLLRVHCVEILIQQAEEANSDEVCQIHLLRVHLIWCVCGDVFFVYRKPPPFSQQWALCLPTLLPTAVATAVVVVRQYPLTSALPWRLLSWLMPPWDRDRGRGRGGPRVL